GQNSSAALSFDDPKAAAKLLESLSTQPGIVSAFLFTPGGILFARYLRSDALQSPEPPSPRVARSWFADGRFKAIHAITNDSQVIGWIYLESDMRELYEHIRPSAMISLGVMACACVFAYLLASRLQRAISDPVIHLVHTAKAVTTLKNYGIRARKQT